MIRNSVLIIPSLNPDGRLMEYVKDLIAHGFAKIILINDGSVPESRPIFDALCSLPECDVLVHTVNMGKGRSLKDAFNYYCQKYAQDYLGVITVDADGQHTLEDVIRLDDAMLIYPDALLLGVRDFDNPSVPFKSRFGNKLTKQVMRVLIGNAAQADQNSRKQAITDTQTGMRGISNGLVRSYLTLAGERFEYETNMLIEALHTHTPVKEIQIKTVYINENSETHFRPLADSAAIYRQIFSTFFKYALASLSSFLIDYGMYSLLILLLQVMPLAARIWIAAAAARILSSLYNYAVNRNVVFKNQTDPVWTMEKYYILCIVQICCSAQMVWLVCRYTSFSEVLVKLFVDMLLFFASYSIQKNWVFRENKIRKKQFLPYAGMPEKAGMHTHSKDTCITAKAKRRIHSKDMQNIHQHGLREG